MRLLLLTLSVLIAAPLPGGAKCKTKDECAWQAIRDPDSTGTGARSLGASGRFFAERRKLNRDPAEKNGPEEKMPDQGFLSSFFGLSKPRQQSILNGINALERGDGKTAYQAGASLKQERPDNPIGYRLTAQALLGAGDSRAAMKEVQSGLKKAPLDEGLNALAKLLKGKLNNAFKPETMIKPKPKPQRKTEFAPPRRRRPAAQPPLPDRSLSEIKEGMTLLNVGDHHKAITHFTDVIDQDPDNSLAFRLRALAHFKLKDFLSALKDIDAAITHAPNDARAHELRGRILSELDRNEEALEAFSRAIQHDPRNATLYLSRARFLKKTGDRRRELADLRLAAALDSAYESLYRRTLSHYHAQDKKSAPKDAVELPMIFLAAAGISMPILFFFLWRSRKARPDSTPTPAGTDFEILRKIGEGGMGEVYAVRDRGLDRVVAVKRMKPGIASNPGERERFLREARTVAALKHPSIVEIHQVIEDGEDLYLVFEIVEGGSLSKRLDNGPLELAEAKTIIHQIAAALDYAHSKNVVHRDLKPANILLAGDRAKVTDFGVAHRVGQTGEIIGTPGFMAPEQLHGTVSPAIDIFALAVCAREMLGRPLPQSLDRATDPNPEKRFATAGEFARAFGDI
ncbi:MAG: hypothetical protein COB53_03080 [Elusimicrobia bacterium]|nr:MAG: hypothetical protein COB53_03080 [Elusimicrobiota bacterium]